MEGKQRILVVDDETQLTRVLRRSLTTHGYDVRVAGDGEFALQTFHDWPPALVITDLAMPNIDGLELCRRLRATSEVPIIVLSVRGDEKTKVEALNLGADDYVTKPFSPRELLARLRAAVRRSQRDSGSDRFHFCDVAVDFAKMELTRKGLPVSLTAHEFKLLKFLVQNAGRVIPRSELLNEVWGYQNYPSTRTVDNHIWKLRLKLESEPDNPVHFLTVHGAGYKFMA